MYIQWHKWQGLNIYCLIKKGILTIILTLRYIGAKFIIVNEEENFNIIMSIVLECNLKCSSGMFGHMTILRTITYSDIPFK